MRVSEAFFCDVAKLNYLVQYIQLFRERSCRRAAFCFLVLCIRFGEYKYLSCCCAAFFFTFSRFGDVTAKKFLQREQLTAKKFLRVHYILSVLYAVMPKNKTTNDSYFFGLNGNTFEREAIHMSPPFPPLYARSIVIKHL